MEARFQDFSVMDMKNAALTKCTEGWCWMGAVLA